MGGLAVEDEESRRLLHLGQKAALVGRGRFQIPTLCAGGSLQEVIVGLQEVPGVSSGVGLLRC